MAVSIVYAFLDFVIGWSGVALLVCGLVGAVMRLRTDGEDAVFFGGVAAGLILLLDSIVIGFDIARDLRVGVDDPDSPYLPVLVAVVAWLVHLPIGLWIVRLSIKALEARAARTARRSGRAPNLPTRIGDWAPGWSADGDRRLARLAREGRHNLGGEPLQVFEDHRLRRSDRVADVDLGQAGPAVLDVL